MGTILDNVYTKLGARPVINAASNTTTWGGSLPSAEVRRAMEEANVGFVEMRELLERSGDFIAETLGVEAAYVTSGCYAALVLSTAACMTGNDPDKMAQLPDTTGLKTEVVLQKQHRYGYDRSYTVAGGKLVEIGDDDGTTLEHLESAIGLNTAAVAYLVKGDVASGALALEDVVRVANDSEVPVISDAAAQVYPLDYFRRNAQSADLVCFGGKYFGSPHSTGFVCGKKDMIEAVANHGFIGPRPFGRGMKVDRQEIVGLVAAFDAWLTMDHEERLLGYGQRFEAIQSGVDDLPSVKKTEVFTSNSYWSLGLHVVIDAETLGKTARDVAQELSDGTPRVRLSASDDDTIVVMVHNLNNGDEQIVAERLRAALVT